MAVYKRDDTWWIDYYAGGKRQREPVGPSKHELPLLEQLFAKAIT